MIVSIIVKNHGDSEHSDKFVFLLLTVFIMMIIEYFDGIVYDHDRCVISLTFDGTFF